jgi:hypothetical protein
MNMLFFIVIFAAGIDTGLIVDTAETKEKCEMARVTVLARRIPDVQIESVKCVAFLVPSK